MGRNALAFQGARRAREALPCATDQREDPPDHGHVVRLHLVAVPRLVVAKTVAGRVTADDLPLSGFPKLPSAASLRRLRPLELGKLVEDAVVEIPLRAAVSPIV
jgi:hypothetical protein